MNFHDLTTEQIVARICNSDSLSEAYTLHQIAAPLLKDYKFIFAADTGALPGFAVNRTFSAGAAVRSLFKTERVFVLDTETAAEMQSGQAIYPIDYSISLDTNAMSYLVPYILGKRGKPIPADFQEVFEFIARPEVYVDPLPYFTENMPNLAANGPADKIFENLKAYEVLRTIDATWLKSKGEIRSLSSDYELAISAQKQISKMYLDAKNDAVMKGVIFRHQYMYACLLKMAMVQLKSPSASVAKKMATFLEFCHSTVATMSTREAVVAREYFTRGQKLTFFGKIQKRKDGILKLLKNMAWDMWHIRQLELSMTFKLTKHARYFFPALLTFDQKFIEIMDLYPLKACAFKMGSNHPMPFFDGDLFQLISGDSEEIASSIKFYFSSSAIAARKKVRDSIEANFNDVIQSLEKELLAVSK